ncbi:nucleoside phosphorylase, partial [Kipferlia bialata]
FTVRELRAVVKGPMCWVRVGTCGSPQEHVSLGDIALGTDGYVSITRNPDGHGPNPVEGAARYWFSRPIKGDEQMHTLLEEELAKELPKGAIRKGVCGSACTFYSSQGRVLPHFND